MSDIFTPAAVGPLPDYSTGAAGQINRLAAPSLDLGLGLAPGAPLNPRVPLTPVQASRLAALRAMPQRNVDQNAELASLVDLAEHDGRQFPLAPDPELVPPLTLSLLGDMMAITSALAEFAPLGHVMANRLAAARATLAGLVFHSSPPAQAPPPVTDPNMQQIRARIAFLEATPVLVRTRIESDELTRAKASIGQL
jgi:hypothetical protein